MEKSFVRIKQKLTNLRIGRTKQFYNTLTNMLLDA